MNKSRKKKGFWGKLGGGMAKTFSPVWTVAGAAGGIAVEVVVEAVPIAATGAVANVLHGIQTGEALTPQGMGVAAAKGAATALLGRYLVHQARKAASKPDEDAPVDNIGDAGER